MSIENDQVAEPWDFLKSPRFVLYMKSRFPDDVDLIQNMYTHSLLAALTTENLQVSIRYDLLQRLQKAADEQIETLGQFQRYKHKSIIARQVINSFANSCLAALEHFEHYDPADPDRNLNELLSRLSRED